MHLKNKIKILSRHIHKTTGVDINYTYDATGNRVTKTVTESGVSKTSYYVRDASGNVMSVYQSGETSMNGGDLTQSEIHLYGSSRLGIYNLNTDVQCIGTPPEITTFIRGNKFFELSNHLGNVLVTVSDKKIAVDANSDGTIDYYNADVVTANDYTPFGMQMVGRKYAASSSKYRYGFNKKENDNDIEGEGNVQDYGMRMYDTRLGRFLSVDPISKKYPELTPFQFASNSPIRLIDVDGLEGGAEEGCVEEDKPEEELERDAELSNLDFSHQTVEPEEDKPEVETETGLSGMTRTNVVRRTNSERLDDLKETLGLESPVPSGMVKSPITGQPVPAPKNIFDIIEAAKSQPVLQKPAAQNVPAKTQTSATSNNVAKTQLHKNSNAAEGNFGLYDIKDAPNGELLKVGKANFDKKTASGDPHRMKVSERAAKKAGYPNAVGTVRKDLGKTTTGEAKTAEAKEVKKERAKGKALPLNKEKDKRYNN